MEQTIDKITIRDQNMRPGDGIELTLRNGTTHFTDKSGAIQFTHDRLGTEQNHLPDKLRGYLVEESETGITMAYGWSTSRRAPLNGKVYVAYTAIEKLKHEKEQKNA